MRIHDLSTPDRAGSDRPHRRVGGGKELACAALCQSTWTTEACGRRLDTDGDAQDQFDDYRESTIGAAFLTQTIALDDQTTVKFEIWDTAGQERYKSLAPMYYRNANCAVVVYDITQAVRPLLRETPVRRTLRRSLPLQRLQPPANTRRRPH